jgi:hypothetical protein
MNTEQNQEQPVKLVALGAGCFIRVKPSDQRYPKQQDPAPRDDGEQEDSEGR